MEKFGPRGVIHSYADGRIEDTGPPNRKRMETVDEEVTAAALDFMDRSVKTTPTARIQRWRGMISGQSRRPAPDLRS